MNPIETYLDNIFWGLPRTDEMARARRRMQETMEEKYDALRGRGKSEAEALGTVVAEFGSVGELLRELGQTVDEGPAPQPVFPEEEYRRFQRRFAIGIGVGVCLCILGIILGGTADSIGLAGMVPVLFFAPIAVGVFLFIYFGIQSERYDELKKMYGWGGYPRQMPEDGAGRSPGAGRKNRVVEAVNGVIMMLATVVFLVAGFVWGLWHPGWVVFPVGGILCGMVSVIGDIWR